MIAVTGAAGKTGLAIVQALARRGAQVRGLVRKPSDQRVVMAAGGTETVVGDVAEPTTLATLLHGARAVYHICPNMHADEAHIGAKVIACAQAAGVAHFVYHSVLHPQTAAMPHHWQKMLVEDQIFASGLDFTVLQPAAYMQNLLASWQSIQQNGIYTIPYPVTTRLSLVDVRDVAEVASRVLTEPGHGGATYEVVGTPPLSQIEVAKVMGQQLGQVVEARELPLDQWARQARAAGLSAYALETLQKMFAYYAAYGLVGNTNGLTWLLGRAPTTLADFLAAILAQEKSNTMSCCSRSGA